MGEHFGTDCDGGPKKIIFYCGSIGLNVVLVGHWSYTRYTQSHFTNSEDYIRARLTLLLTDQQMIMKSSDDEYDFEDKIVESLLKLLPGIFPSNTYNPELSVLFHDDL
jgi:hypothetical protein